LIEKESKKLMCVQQFHLCIFRSIQPESDKEKLGFCISITELFPIH